MLQGVSDQPGGKLTQEHQGIARGHLHVRQCSGCKALAADARCLIGPAEGKAGIKEGIRWVQRGICTLGSPADPSHQAYML